MKSWHAIGALAVSVASCGPQSQPPQPANNASSPVIPVPSAPPAVSNSSPSAPTRENDTNVQDREAPPVEPKGPIDSKSAEAAAQVIQHYGALIEQRKFDEAGRLWGNPNNAGNFRLQLRRYPEVHLAVGKAGHMEGAAGSIYVTVPGAFYGTDQNGAQFRRSAEFTLRRVNDVPGSTEQQRRWHIERIEWKNSS